MYSRNADPRPPSARGYNLDRFPSYRQRRRVEVPPGYSGHAIIDGEERPLGDELGTSALPTDRPVPELPHEPTPEPRFDDLPRVSEGSLTARRPTDRPEVSLPLEEPSATAEWPPYAPPPPYTAPPSSPSPRTGMGLLDSAHFPFGHGFGFEEWLLLGLMLFLLREARDGEDRGDLEETLLMLGALLLAG